jgi:YbbR domain-containing protein
MIGRIFRWLTEGSLTATMLGKQAVLSLRSNWGLAALSIVLASSLWVYVTDRSDSDITVRIPGSIAVECVNIPSGMAVSPPCAGQTIVVRVRGPESTIDDLTGQDFRATADLAGINSSSATVPITVEPREPRVEVVEVSPAEITVNLEELVSRTVPVRVRTLGVPPRGFEVADIQQEPAEAIVSGPEALVARVAAAEIDLDITGARSNFSQTLALSARDDQGGAIENVAVAPESASVTVELRQLDFSAPFVVVPSISGSPSEGFVVTGLLVEPQFVVVSGPADVLQTLDPVQGVGTEPISLDGANADVVRTVSLRLPDGVRADQDVITVRVSIEQSAFTPSPSGASP